MLRHLLAGAVGGAALSTPQRRLFKVFCSFYEVIGILSDFSSNMRAIGSELKILGVGRRC